MCRICYEDEGQMISPCLCKGENKYVHLQCLNEWRSTTELNFNKCPICRYIYDTEVTKQTLFIKILMLMYKEVDRFSLIFSAAILLIINYVFDKIIIFLLNSIDKSGLIENFFYKYNFFLWIPLFIFVSFVSYDTVVEVKNLFGYSFIVSLVAFISFIHVIMFHFYTKHVVENTMTMYFLTIGVFMYKTFTNGRINLIDTYDYLASFLHPIQIENKLKRYIKQCNQNLHGNVIGIN